MRWRHGESCVRRTAEEAGLAVAGLVAAAAPRTEAGKDVPWLAVALCRD